jgi:hypothetical protein
LRGLPLDQRIELRHAVMVGNVEQRRLQQPAILGAQLRVVPEHRGQDRLYHPDQGFAIACEVGRRCARHQPEDE